MEAEEQRYLNESMREENKVKKEIEAYINRTKIEEKNYSNEIADAKSKMSNANSEQVIELKQLIESLNVKLELASREKERAISTGSTNKGWLCLYY